MIVSLQLHRLIMYTFLISPTHATCAARPFLLVSIDVIIFGGVKIMKFLVMQFFPTYC